MGVGRLENLVSVTERTAEEARKMSVRGGQQSGRARRKQRTFRESLKLMLELNTKDEQIRAQLLDNGVEPTILNAINFAQTTQAMKGNTDAARFVRDTIGEKPRDALELGNLDERPLATIDLSKLSDDELRALAASRAGSEPTK